MKSSKIYFLTLGLLISLQVFSQNKRQFKIHTVAFYNVENLFDTINDPNKFDEASPIMELNYNRQAVYEKKVKNMAHVISEIGSEISRNSPAVIGLAEVENRKVLEDLANDEALLAKNYGIVHFDSPDARGIDVALMYQKAIFVPLNKSKHELKIYDDESRNRVYTRDQLLVSGKLEGELVHFIVNHWPSRRGGEARSRPKRIAAAKLNKRIIDSLQAIDPYAKIFTMGDLNDDPTNASVKEILKAERRKEKVPLKGIYNPMENLARKGMGTNAYRDGWSLFDQILFTKPLLDKDYSSFRFYKAGIFNKNYLTNKKGRWKGYPLRSFADGSFTNGYSDHFPVYVTLIKEVPSSE
ncbi:MAG: endonuclease/exonuclease/phosphatase family protein [Flavobacteriaceae bacterium]|nr:endonuclease/exonuclease/phosphatase family protein [Bacteroidia bacterium]MBT8287102.1 endonuclease/exonuclease/phosphatase family protein [Bacteroidia bacterium]NNF74291.1 endonuclease/exonuclease/phosphatase family protein [Flavobacteriaceae bacterium]NNK73557.1 endonuclease/exonuclease/phosphatase family protein [Flavobacteriaceae bacterium]